MEYMKNNGESDRTPWSSLSKILGYSRNTIHIRYTKTLLPGDKVVTGRFTKKENRAIMETIFEENGDAYNHHFFLSDPVWEKLGSNLNRNPYTLFHHWDSVIRPQILMYENGVDHVDFRPILVDYFIEKGILFRNETNCNWSEIVKDKRFKGTTATYLSNMYGDLVRRVKKTNPGIEDDDITSEVLRQYLDNKSRNPIKTKQHSRIIEDYVDIKNSL